MCNYPKLSDQCTVCPYKLSCAHFSGKPTCFLEKCTHTITYKTAVGEICERCGARVPAPAPTVTITCSGRSSLDTNYVRLENYEGACSTWVPLDEVTFVNRN